MQPRAASERQSAVPAEPAIPVRLNAPSAPLAPKRDGRSPLVLALGTVALAAIALVDALTGPDLSLAFMYLGPVCWVSWHYPRRVGVAIAVLAALGWMAAAAHDGHLTDRTLFIWNVAGRMVTFGVGALLTHRLRETQRALQEANILLQSALTRERTLARTDHRTGLLNTAGLSEAMGRELSRARRHQESLSALYLDLDDFKRINDTYGHEQGDQVLVTVGNILKGVTRREDIAARVGGDEFFLLLPGTPEADAAAVGERILGSLREAGRDDRLRVGASIGVRGFRVPPAESDEVIRLVDELMYVAKRSGKGKVLKASEAALA